MCLTIYENNKQTLCYRYRLNTPRSKGGLGSLNIPLLSDLTHNIAKDYGVYLEDLGHTLRYVYFSQVHVKDGHT